jgi:hypothetical protein
MKKRRLAQKSIYRNSCSSGFLLLQGFILKKLGDNAPSEYSAEVDELFDEGMLGEFGARA